MLLTSRRHRAYDADVISPATLDTLPTADDWLASPLPPLPFEIRRRERSATLAARRHIRYLYFDLGRGMIKRLASADDRAAIRSAQRDAFDGYRHRCVVEARPPLRYRQYLRTWRAWQRRVWLKFDVPRAARERLGIGPVN